MRSILLTLTLLLTIGACANAGDILDYYRVWERKVQAVQSFQSIQAAEVEQHPKANEPIKLLDRPLPAHLAQKHLSSEQYTAWALTWNAYNDEQADRNASQRVLYGSTVTTTRTTNGAVSKIVPRFWIFQQGTPGQVRYNPFVAPKR